MSGKPDWELAERIVNDEFTFVTNNRMDFLRVFAKIELHTGLIVIVPNVVPSVQCALFEAALQYVVGRVLVNAVIEISLDRQVVRCIEYQLPTDQSRYKPA